MNYMDRAKKNSQRYIGPEGEVVSEWQIYLGLQSGRLDGVERTDEGYRLDGVRYAPVRQE